MTQGRLSLEFSWFRATNSSDFIVLLNYHLFSSYNRSEVNKDFHNKYYSSLDTEKHISELDRIVKYSTCIYRVTFVTTSYVH